MDEKTKNVLKFRLLEKYCLLLGRWGDSDDLVVRFAQGEYTVLHNTRRAATRQPRVNEMGGRLGLRGCFDMHLT